MWCIYLQSDLIKRIDVWSKFENEIKIPVAGYLMTPKKLKDTSKYVNSDTVFKVCIDVEFIYPAFSYLK